MIERLTRYHHSASNAFVRCSSVPGSSTIAIIIIQYPTIDSSSRPSLANPTPPPSICDLQDKFRSAIHEFPKVITTTQKLLKASQTLSIPVFATTQLRGKLGETCAELNLDTNNEDSIKTHAHADKTRFSMWIPEVRKAFDALGPEKREVVIVGIESHICVTQTALDLLAEGHKVYVLADGVSSCNPQEVPIALARLRSEGVVVTTSESFLYECMGDAGIGEFREMSKLVKEFGSETRDGLRGLCSHL
jgi:nicotinamidase-related amidase